MNIVSEYLEAKNKYEEHKKIIEDLSKLFDKVSSALTLNPEKFVFVNVTDEIGKRVLLPEESFKGVQCDAKDWPSAYDIQCTLKKFHYWRLRAYGLYSQIEESIKNGLAAP